MCLAFFRPQGTDSIPKAALDAACSRNPDGFGLAWVEHGALRTARFPPSGRSAFVKRYRIVEQTGAAVIAHARFATHGDRTTDNAHPFVYLDPSGFEVAVIHNGVLPIHTEPGRSDTETFARLVLTQMPTQWWDNHAVLDRVSEAIGFDNKLVLMTATGEVVIVNERAGTWRGGIWLSNTYSVAPSYQYNDALSVVGI